MRVLANENFPLDAIEALRKNGHDVAWIREDACGSQDEDVLSRAQREDRILVTFDKDFGELAFHSKLPSTSGVILFRISASSSQYNTHGHKLRFPPSKKAQFVTECGIHCGSGSTSTCQQNRLDRSFFRCGRSADTNDASAALARSAILIDYKRIQDWLLSSTLPEGAI